MDEYEQSRGIDRRDKIKRTYCTRMSDDKQKNTVIWVLAIIGAVAAVAAIAYGVYQILHTGLSGRL